MVRTDLTNTVQVSGSLGYAGSYTGGQPGRRDGVHRAAGAGRDDPAAASVLYEVDGTPVTLFYGAGARVAVAVGWASRPAGTWPQLDRQPDRPGATAPAC